MDINSPFNNLYSLKEASNLWKVEESVLRRNISSGKFKVNIEVKKFGKQWVITKEAMIRVYGINENNKTLVNYNNKQLKSVNYFISDCLIKYSLRSKKDIETSLKDFKRYNIIKYLYECYESLEGGPKDNVIKDVSSRIRRGVRYESRL